jgi:hypothetical protein
MNSAQTAVLVYSCEIVPWMRAVIGYRECHARRFGSLRLTPSWEVWQLITAQAVHHRGFGTSTCQERVHDHTATQVQKAWVREQTCRTNRKARQHDWLDSVNFVAINPDEIHWCSCKRAKCSSS